MCNLALKDLVGKTIINIKGGNVNDDCLTFYTDDGYVFEFSHEQDCCESVYISDVTGDLSDIIGHPITLAEEATSSEDPPRDYSESFTWTFYKFATIRGYVDIRWLGESNGYYSESVDLRIFKNE